MSENWNQSILTKLAELATSITALAATAAASAALLARRVNTAVTPVNSTDDTNGTAFCSFALVAGKKYRFTGTCGCETALASTALNLRMTASGGLVAANACASWATAQTTTMVVGSTVIEDWTAFTSGLGTTDRTLRISGIIEPTVSGTLIFQMRSEVSGSRVDVLYGNILMEDVT